MYKHLLKAIIVSAAILLNQASAQQIDETPDPEETQFPGRYPSYMDFEAFSLTFRKDEVPLLDDAGKVFWSKQAVLKSIEKDEIGYEHYRYQQTYNGIPLEHAVCIIHVKDGNKIVSENGKMVKKFPADLAAKPLINTSNALNIAIGEIGARQYKWEIPAEEAFLKKEQDNTTSTYYPKGELVYYSGDKDVIPSELRLAYKFDIYAHFPLSRYMVFVDAATGRFLGKRSLITDCSKEPETVLDNTTIECKDAPLSVTQGQDVPNTFVPSTALTGYSGQQFITSLRVIDYVYFLREQYVQTFNMKNAGKDYSAAHDFVHFNNIWVKNNADQDQYALDAHWGAKKTYDYFKQKFNRNSIDNAGKIIKNYVHTDLVAQGLSSNKNARWDGTRASYGDGGKVGDNTYTPITTLDIVGHEITHGVTQYTSELVYSYEPGALSEGFSDIFGTCIEFYAKPANKANWQIAEEAGPLWRDMSNPNARGCADTYKGYLWKTGEGDYGGVHNNSGVLDFWFYLLVNGGSGTNDKGKNYSLTGIGMDKAAAIAYRVNTVYLISTSGYNDVRKYGIKAAEDLYGKGSMEAIQTNKAFAAVGLETVILKANINLLAENDNINLFTASSFKVFPNPLVGNKITVELERENESIEQMVISDITGKIIFTKNMILSKGINKIPVELPMLKSGMYFIKAGEKSIKLIAP
ncbi:MAG: M4 family metallopeptidase [Chitinophagaceae bacterium]|nr:M4 family metallopeptidase [Chitinophagaceae bacterium]